MDERGAVLVWTMVVVAMTAAVLVLMGGVTRDAGDDATLQSTADLAALAAVRGGHAAAARVATSNGATLQGTSRTGEVWTVVVERSARRAMASAGPEEVLDGPTERGADPGTPRGGP